MRASRSTSPRAAFSFLKYFLLNGYFRALIFIIPYPKLKSALKAAQGPAAPVSTARWIGWHVFHAAQFVPHATCVSRALTAHFILRRQGFASTIRVGVATENGSLLAHAWVLSGDQVVVGNEAGELDRYSALADVGNN